MAKVFNSSMYRGCNSDGKPKNKANLQQGCRKYYKIGGKILGGHLGYTGFYSQSALFSSVNQFSNRDS